MEAFEAIHSLNVVHGDVRPENILVAEDNSVWIVDFEFAQILEGNSEERKSVEMDAVREMLRNLERISEPTDRYEVYSSQEPVTEGKSFSVINLL